MKKQMRKLSLLLACSLWAGFLFAQDLQLKGKVIYAQNSEGVPYCYVQLKDVAIGTVTDYGGTFSLTIPSKYREGILVFSYVGYQKQFINLAQLSNPQNIKIALVEEVKQLQDIVVKSKREKRLNPKNILKEALDAIPKNYPQSVHNLEAYQRETLRENGAFIKYADAVCKYYSDAYLGRKYAFKDIAQRKFGIVTIVLGSNIWASGRWGERLHDHFEDAFITKFVKDEVEIIASRANENLSTENMQANIEGGAVGIFAKDIVRYIDWFLHKKNFRDYNYEVKEGYDKHLALCYVVSFYPRKKPMTDEELEEKIKKNKRISRDDILAGEIYIDPATLAFKYIKATVPPEFKKQICNLQKMNIKHFGYDLEIEYTQDPVSKYWYPLKISKQDEFIFADTIKNKVIPYQANSELYFQKLITDSTQVKKLTGENVYTIQTMMPLFDEPVAYYPEFWQAYAQKNPLSIIPDSIRQNLEVNKPLEKQFEDRHLRNDSLKAPIAQTKKFQYKIHQETITDDYAWLKDTSALVRYNQEVMDYLKAENEYIENYCKPLRRDQRRFYQNLISRIPKETESLPRYLQDYYYVTKYEADKEYPIFYRTKDSTKAEKEILFDVNKMAEGQSYFSIDGFAVSPDNDLIAYFANTTGADVATLYFKKISADEILADSLEQARSVVWEQNNTLYYTKQAARTLRSFQVWKHTLFTPQSEDVLIYQEDDPEFQVGIGKSLDKNYLFIGSYSSTSSEVRFKKTDEPDSAFRIIHPREQKHKYSVSVFEGNFYIVSDKNAPDGKVLMTSPEEYPIKHWKEIISHQAGVMIDDFKPLKNYYVISETENAANRIKIIDLATKKSHYIKFPEEVYTCWILSADDPARDPNLLRVGYSSFTTPTTIYDYDITSKKLTVVKKEHLVGYGNTNRIFKVERLFATAKDGRQIPISLFYRKDTPINGTSPLWIKGYGAYGANSSVGFSTSLLSLLNAGFIYAVAHVRGGSEGGNAWHEEGRLLNKINSFTDFIACTEHLIAQKYADPQKVVAQGGSAGGLLMGAIANMRPDLYHTVILDVPFVDVINTMLDDKLPLTTGEYQEWGNPHQKKYFKYMQSYSPYDNVKAQDYPNMLFFTALNDTRVGYWEAAKMVAKLRTLKTDTKEVFLKTNLQAGHGGGSGRFEGYREFAYQLALVLNLLKQNVPE